MPTNVEKVDPLDGAKVPADGPKNAVQKDRVVKVRPRAIFFANVQAAFGKGKVTCVVTGVSDNKAELHGARNLVKCGLLPQRFYTWSGKPSAMQAAMLAFRQDGPKTIEIVRGAAACRAWLKANNIEGIDASCIISDVIRPGGDDSDNSSAGRTSRFFD